MSLIWREDSARGRNRARNLGKFLSLRTRFQRWPQNHPQSPDKLDLRRCVPELFLAWGILTGSEKRNRIVSEPYLYSDDARKSAFKSTDAFSGFSGRNREAKGVILDKICGRKVLCREELESYPKPAKFVDCRALQKRKCIILYLENLKCQESKCSPTSVRKQVRARKNWAMRFVGILVPQVETAPSKSVLVLLCAGISQTRPLPPVRLGTR